MGYMKRPILDETQRLLIRLDTMGGQRLKLALSWMKLKREIEKEVVKMLPKN